MATRSEGWGDTPAKFYIDDQLLPVAPHTFSISQNSKNESASLFDGRPYTRPRLMNAQTMSIEFLLPFYDEDTITESTWAPRMTWTDFFWEIQQERKPVLITVWYPTGETYNGKWMLDSWNYSQSASKGSDWDFSLSLTEFYPNENTDTNYVLENPNVLVGARDYRRVS